MKFEIEDCIGSRYYLHARNNADALIFLLKNTMPTMYYDSMHEIIKPDDLNYEFDYWFMIDWKSGKIHPNELREITELQKPLMPNRSLVNTPGIGDF